MSGELVLVTGGTGFVGAHCIVALLREGYRVRTTVRALDRAGQARDLVRAGGEDPTGIEFVVADLMQDDGWLDAVDGTRYVLHVASPLPVRQPKDANELIEPAREGVLRVLRAARDTGVRRVVQTSSFAAIGYGTDPGRPFTEADWTDLTAPHLTPYIQSKTLAERAAWEFIEREGAGLEFATVNPVVIFGPALGADFSTSIHVLLRLLNGKVPAVPPGTTTGVDVRDVADLHVLAMRHPDAAGERFLAVAGDPISFLREQVIQPHLPVRLPCYDLVLITDPTFDGSLTGSPGRARSDPVVEPDPRGRSRGTVRTGRRWRAAPDHCRRRGCLRRSRRRHGARPLASS